MKAPLPIDEVLPELLARLREFPNLVLRAPTGAGKTTRVPPALDAAGLAGGRRIVMLEPRRVAARAAARRIAEENGFDLGREVGYQIRLERRFSEKTRILVVTEGILVAMLQGDPFLEDVGVVLFDEFHERNLQSDLALAMARRVQREVRDDLRLVVMSATLDPDEVAAWLGRGGGGNEGGGDEHAAPVVRSEGRLHPVEIRRLERPDERPVPLRVAAGVRRVLGETPGDVLAFLPGVGEIRRTAEELADLEAHGLAVMPLYGELPPERQDAVLRPGPRRKVVLATNVAETSITIDGVTAVVDSGLARILRLDPGTGLDRLELERISRGSADQRSGRAGRQQPGICLRLWTEHDELTLQEHETPEIRRVDLAGPALQLMAWGEADLAAFGWFEAPETAALERARELLTELEALDAHGLTNTGRALARMAVHPRLARLLAAGHERGVLRRAALAAALLGERDVVVWPRHERPVARHVSPSDLLDRVEAVERLAERGAPPALVDIHRGRARHVLRLAKELERQARRALGTPSEEPHDPDEALLRSLLAAYPDRVARRRPSGAAEERRALMVGGRGVRLAESSAVKEAELFVALDLDAGRRPGEGGREARVRMASMVRRDWLPAAAVRTLDEVEFDRDRQRVIGRRRTFYHDLPLAESEVAPSPEEAARVLTEAALEDPETALALDRDEVAAFLARVRSLAEWMPELGLPSFGEDDLREVVAALSVGKRSFAELKRGPVLDFLRGRFDYPKLEALERHAPERLKVPSGSRIRLRYEPGEPPVLAARIQELFGLVETPRLAAGRVPVLLHLLAPNHRPQQITRDLASFWRNTYPEVKKELQGRYPKHAWPDDPLTAQAERRPRRRR